MGSIIMMPHFIHGTLQQLSHFLIFTTHRDEIFPKILGLKMEFWVHSFNDNEAYVDIVIFEDVWVVPTT